MVMELSYELTGQDFLAFNKQVIRLAQRRARNVGLYAVLWVCVFTATVVILSLDSVEALSVDWPSALWSAAVTGGLLISAITVYSRRLRRYSMPEPLGYLLGPRTLAIRDSRISIEGTNYRLDLELAGIRNVVETSQHVFLFLDTVAAVIVPKTAFKSEAQVNAFAAQVKRESQTGK